MISGFREGLKVSVGLLGVRVSWFRGFGGVEVLGGRAGASGLLGLGVLGLQGLLA